METTREGNSDGALQERYSSTSSIRLWGTMLLLSLVSVPLQVLVSQNISREYLEVLKERNDLSHLNIAENVSWTSSAHKLIEAFQDNRTNYTTPTDKNGDGQKPLVKATKGANISKSRWGGVASRGSVASPSSRPMPPHTPGAYIHIGKAGGSTMCSQLANGCHSWIPKPCAQIRNETGISLLTTYYHTPDFPRETIRIQPYTFYVVQIRDPLARFRSIFGAYHVNNAPFRDKKDQFMIGKGKRERQSKFSRCFPTLEHFALATGRNTTWDTSHLEKKETRECSRIPNAVFGYRMMYSDHWYWNHDTIYRKALAPNQSFQNATILALRTETLWDDWVTANQYLGDESVVAPTNATRARGYSLVEMPVSIQLSESGRKNLCIALASDYKAYVSFLRKAENVDNQQKHETLKISQRNCPWLGLTLNFR